MFQVSYQKDHQDQCYIVKLDKKDKILSEHQACLNLTHCFSRDLANLAVKIAIEPDEKIGAIWIKNIENGGAQVGNVRELKEIAFDIESSESLSCSNNGLANLYKRICTSAYSHAKSESVKIQEEYGNYLRLDTVPQRNRIGTRDLLQAALGNQYNRELVSLYGVEVYNPLIMLDMLLKLETKMMIGPIHGDMHTSNVVFDADYRPWLIDFAWGSNKGHILKDFVLMENSIRFMNFPKNIIHDSEIEIDRHLVYEDGYISAKCVKAYNDWVQNHTFQMLTLIGTVREYAKISMGTNWCFKEYLIAQFLVLLGSICHYDYNFRGSVRTLGLIANELKDKV